MLKAAFTKYFRPIVKASREVNVQTPLVKRPLPSHPTSAHSPTPFHGASPQDLSASFSHSSFPLSDPSSLLSRWKASLPSTLSSLSASASASASSARAPFSFTIEQTTSLLSLLLRGTLRARPAPSAGLGLMMAGVALQVAPETPEGIFQRTNLPMFQQEASDPSVPGEHSLPELPEEVQAHLPHSLLSSPSILAAQALFSSPAFMMAMEWKSLTHQNEQQASTIKRLNTELGETRRQLMTHKIDNRNLRNRVSDMEKEKERLLDEMSERLCLTCCQRPPNVVYGCHHLVVCEECDQKILENHLDCPVCRKQIQIRIPFIL